MGGLVVLWIFGSLGSDDYVASAETEAPQTADALYASMIDAWDRGAATEALGFAEVLIGEHEGTAEADSAAAKIDSLTIAAQAEEVAREERRAQEALEAERSRLARKWTYSLFQDDMSSRSWVTARILSENEVSFGWPYGGSQRGRLTLRIHPRHGTDVIFRIERGQILCQSYRDCTIRVRFDEGQAERWSAVGPSDNSSESIFLRNYGRFLQRMRNAEVVRLEVPIYQEGSPVFEFHVSGFDMERYQAGS